MTEERLKEIADSISLQEQVMEAYGQDMLLVEEEKELYNEVIRLRSALAGVKEKIEGVQIFGLRSGKTLISTLLNDALEIIDNKENINASQKE